LCGPVHHPLSLSGHLRAVPTDPVSKGASPGGRRWVDTGADMASSTANDLVEPTKPANAYWMWMGDNREKIVKDLGTAKGPQVSKLAGERWKGMTEAERAPYVKKAEAKKAEYDKALQEFLDKGGQKAKRKEKASKGEPQTKRARRLELKEKRIAAGKPTRPQNAYWIWLCENRPKFVKEAGTGNVGKVGKLAGERWKSMSAAEKEPFEKQAQARKAAYEAELAKWKASAKAQGDEGDAGSEEEDGDDEEAEE